MTITKLFAFLAATCLATMSFAQGDTGKPMSPASAQPASKETPKSEPARSEKPAAPKTSDTKPKPNPEYEYVRMSTSKGDIVVALDKTNAPISTANFMSYVDKKFYDNTVFHRVLKDFVVQGGGFDAELKEKTTEAPIKNEWDNGLKNTKGTIAMARQAAADSATSQFYFNVGDNAALDIQRPPAGNAAYAVFGHVVSGMDVLDAIRSVKTTERMGAIPSGKPIRLENCPTENVVLRSVVKISKAEAEKAEKK